MNVAALRQCIHPEDLRIIERHYETLSRVRSNEKLSSQFRARHANGEWRHLHSWDTVFSRSNDGFPTQVLGMALDVTEQKLLERQVLETAGEEQRRISRELHDRTGQVLTGLGLMARNLSEALADKLLPEAKDARKIAVGISDALAQIHGVIKGLDPVDVDAGGLMAALTELASRCQEMSGVTCRFVCEKPVLLDDNRVATDLYYIAQEAVTNSLKHARPKNVSITLNEKGGQILLEVRDDGTGFILPENTKKGIGLRIMRYRAGRIGAHLEIKTGAESGTWTICSFGRQKAHA
jgi:signal transduction histidine kinase